MWLGCNEIPVEPLWSFLAERVRVSVSLLGVYQRVGWRAGGGFYWKAWGGGVEAIGSGKTSSGIYAVESIFV